MGSKANDYLLAKYDVSGIQDYIFATNRLRENAGASHQVTEVLEKHLLEAFREAAAQEGVPIELDWGLDDRLRLTEDAKIMAEIVYIGGGNAMALFRSRSLYHRVGQRLGIMAAKNCQGIYLAAASIETSLQDFVGDKARLDEEMNRVKRGMARQPSFSPFPVVEQDDSSHQPIIARIQHETRTEYLTRAQVQKRDAYKKEIEEKNNRLYPLIGGKVDYVYPEEADQLCREHGEDSRIAVVHIDGNGMGDRFNGLVMGHRPYSEGIPAIRRGSKEISGLFQDTYAAVLKVLWDCQVFIGPDGGTKGTEEVFPGTEEVLPGTDKMFPLRPLLMDGDDFTFLCRADLAIPVAAGFMRGLMEKQQREEQMITACGGIAFVHSHFPFRVAYSIAEESCDRAKKKWYKQREADGGAATCYLDFQVVKESEIGLPKRNDALKKRPYAVCLNEHEVKAESLISLCNLINEIKDWPSGRLHRLSRALCKGDDEMVLLRREFESRGYMIDYLAQGDWRHSPLFDALELQGACRLDLLKRFLNIQ